MIFKKNHFYIFLICLTLTSTHSVLSRLISRKNIKSLEYIIEPKFEKNKTYLDINLFITLKKANPEENVLFLCLPDKFAMLKELYLDIKNLKCSKLTIKNFEKKPAFKSIENITTNKIHLNYSVKCSLKNLGKLNHSCCLKPIICEKYIHLIGPTFIIFPTWDFDKEKVDDLFSTHKFNIKITWKKFPLNWNIANSHGVNKNEQNLFISILELINSIYVAGDFQINKFLYKENPVYTATRGNWPFQTKKLESLLETIIKTERNFWNDYDFPFFLVTTIPIEENNSIMGTCLHNSFVTFLGPQKSPLKKLAHNFSHEHFHTWNGKKIRKQSPEKLMYWFSEGFTDYYAFLLNLRSGLISLEEYIEEYNDRLYYLYTSPVKNKPNNTLLKNMWNNQKNLFSYLYQFQKLPYLRGQVLAHHWNAKIKKKTAEKYSLDNVMLDILHQATKNNKVISAQLFDELIKKYLPSGVIDDIEKYINKGKTIIFDRNSLGPCCTLVWNKVKNITSLGFETEFKNETEIIINVNKKSDAFKKGIRTGQTILKCEIPFHARSDKLIEVKVKNLDKTEKNIQFYPEGNKIFDVPQYVFDKNYFKQNTNECLEWFGIKKNEEFHYQ